MTYGALADSAGTDLGRSRWIVIDQDRMDAFAAVVDDHQWILTDSGHTAHRPFSASTTDGYLLTSVVAAVLDELFCVSDAGASIVCGADVVRFHKPVTPGAKLCGHGEIIDVAALTNVVHARVRVTVAAENADKPACVAEVLIRVYPPEQLIPPSRHCLTAAKGAGTQSIGVEP